MYYNLSMTVNMQTAQSHNERLEKVKQYISSHINESLNREVLAAVAGFSVSHFHCIFTRHVGENISSYVRRMRLERAGRKLRMGAVDITEVALAAEYETHAAFGKAFKQRYGLSPSQFRQLDCPTATQILTKG
jgi:AraC family transcriptional regulator